MASKTTLYPHRRNKDGSYDSICPTCFATVGRSKAKADLAEDDRAHVCDSEFLAERGVFARAETRRRTAAQPRAPLSA